MIIKVNHRVKDTDIVCEQKWQAMPVLIHSAHRGKNPDVISPSALLVEGSAPKPPLNTEFHSVATRSANALKGYAKAPSLLRCHGINRSTLTPDGYRETQ